MALRTLCFGGDSTLTSQRVPHSLQRGRRRQQALRRPLGRHAQAGSCGATMARVGASRLAPTGATTYGRAKTNSTKSPLSRIGASGQSHRYAMRFRTVGAPGTPRAVIRVRVQSEGPRAALDTSTSSPDRYPLNAGPPPVDKRSAAPSGGVRTPRRSLLSATVSGISKPRVVEPRVDDDSS